MGLGSCLFLVSVYNVFEYLFVNFYFIAFTYAHVFVTAKGLDHVAENILSYLDADSLRNAELVCKEWFRVISEGMLWKKLIERKVRTDSLWRGLAERRMWWVYLVIFEIYT